MSARRFKQEVGDRLEEIFPGKVQRDVPVANLRSVVAAAAEKMGGTFSQGADGTPTITIEYTIAASTKAERDDVLAYLERRIANAAAIEASTAPTADTREIAGDRRRQLEVIRDEIEQGMHTSAAAVAAKLSEDSAAGVLRDGLRPPQDERFFETRPAGAPQDERSFETRPAGAPQDERKEGAT